MAGKVAKIPEANPDPSPKPHRWISTADEIGIFLAFFVIGFLTDSVMWKLILCGFFLIWEIVWIWIRFPSFSRVIRILLVVIFPTATGYLLGLRILDQYEKEHPAPLKYQPVTPVDLEKSEHRVLGLVKSGFQALPEQIKDKPYKIEKKDFRFYLDGFPFPINYVEKGSAPLKRKGIIQLSLHNLNKEHPMSEFFVDVFMKGCQITSTDARWQTAQEAAGDYGAGQILSLHYCPQLGFVPITPDGGNENLPDIDNDCGQSPEGELRLQLRPINSLAIAGNIKFKFPENFR